MPAKSGKCIALARADGASTDNQLSLTFVAMHVQAWKWRMMTVRTQADGTVELHGSTSADEFHLNDAAFLPIGREGV